MKRTEIRRTAFKRKSGAKVLRARKPLRSVGRKGKANIAANKVIDRDAEKRSARHCELCGNEPILTRSHDAKRRHLSKGELEQATILGPICHDWIEYTLDADEQKEVNVFLREHSDDEPGYKVEQLRKLVPVGKWQILKRRLGIWQHRKDMKKCVGS